MMTPSHGAAKAAEVALLHAARNDRTIRKTLIAAGVIEAAD